MTRVALRSIRSHLGRFAMSVVAVLLGVAFVAGTFSLRTMMSSTFDSIVQTTAKAQTYVRGELIDADAAPAQGVVSSTAGRERVPMSLVDTIRDVPGVKAAVADISGPIVLVGSEGTAVTGQGGAPSMGMAFNADDPTMVIAPGGRAPSVPGEIALETSSLKTSGLAVGDTTKILIGGQVADVTVVGELKFETAIAGALIVGLDPQTAAQAWAPDGSTTTISVYGDTGESEKDLTAAVQQALDGQSVDVLTGTDLRAEVSAQIRSIMGFVSTFLLVFAAIALFVGAFIITNTFQMTVRQRQREFAMLRAVGASPRQVFTSILVQALVVGVLGAAGGVGAGVGLVAVLRQILARGGMEMNGDIPLDGFTVAVSVTVGALVSVVAAALPARHAAITPPVEAMREDDVQHDSGTQRWRAALGAVLLAGGVAAVLTAAFGDLGNPGPVLGAGAAGVLIGALVLAPALVPSILGVLAWPAVATLRPLGGLARGNVTRNPRRTASTAGALMVGMALVGAAAVLATSTQASVRSVVDTESRSDLLLRSATFDIPAGVVDEVRALPDVAQAYSLGVASLSVDGTSDQVVSADPGLFGTALDVPVVAGDLGALDRGEVLATKKNAEENGWHVGDTVALRGSTGEATATIGGIIDSRAVETDLVLPVPLLDRLTAVTERRINTVFLSVADGTSLDDAKAEITDTIKPYLVVSVMDNDEFGDSLAQNVNQVLVILYALLGLSVVIAVLGIVNTLALSIAERTREIGLLRAVGLGRLQLASVVTVESVLTAVFGTLMGVAIGVGLASALPRIYADEGLSELVIPWGQLGIFLGLAVVVGAVAAAWPAIRAARMDVLRAISYE